MNFNLRKFYLIGFWIMLLATIGSLWNLILIWNFINIGGKISTIFGGVLFQLLISIIFYFMYKTTPDMNLNLQQFTDMDKILDDMQEKEIIIFDEANMKGGENNEKEKRQKNKDKKNKDKKRKEES